MHTEQASIPAQANAVLSSATRVLDGALLAVYLHGSAVSGGLRPQSDVDLILVVDHPMTAASRTALLGDLLRISGRHPAPPGAPRCVETMAFLRSDLAVPTYPARAEFVYGEWLRARFEAGKDAAPASDPEITLVLAQARREARPLFGPTASELLPEIPEDHVRRAMRDALPTLLGCLHGDERNVLLTLCRMWRTALTGDFVTKDAAAAWVVPRAPGRVREVLARARDGYLGDAEDDGDESQEDVRHAAEYLRNRLEALL